MALDQNGKAKGGKVKEIQRTRRGPKPSEKNGRKKTEFEQAPLMSYLAAEATNRNETPLTLAKHLGIGYAYLTQLLRCKRDTSKLRREVLVAAAKYLDVPVAQAYLWAKALKPTDFVHEHKFEALSGDAYDVMSRHPLWGGFLPSKDEWNSISSRARLFIVLAFEQATGETIIDKSAKTAVSPTESS